MSANPQGPNLAVAARRLYDIGKSGWWQLVGIIPIAGWIIVIVWFATDSQGDNKYGPIPKGSAAGPCGSPPPAA